MTRAFVLAAVLVLAAPLAPAFAGAPKAPAVSATNSCPIYVSRRTIELRRRHHGGKGDQGGRGGHHRHDHASSISSRPVSHGY